MRLLITSTLLVAALFGSALAAEPMRSYESMANFRVSVGEGITLEKLGATGEAAVTFAAVMPPGARGLSVVGFKSQTGISFRLAAAATEARGKQDPYVAIQFGEQKPQLLPDTAAHSGPLASVSVWDSAAAGTVLVTNYATSELDTPLEAWQLDANGGLHFVELGGARSLGGAHELRDLDGNSSYELLTQRHLDGWNGGITYTAVRTYDAATRRYAPDPDRFREFFRGELVFYDWVLSTREQIVEYPERFLSSEPRGWYFAADYEGRLVGFDSLVPLEDIEFAAGNIAQWNGRVDSAVRRVTEYRDQLKAWLDGGTVYPTAWQMKK